MKLDESLIRDILQKIDDSQGFANFRYCNSQPDFGVDEPALCDAAYQIYQLDLCVGFKLSSGGFTASYLSERGEQWMTKRQQGGDLEDVKENFKNAWPPVYFAIHFIAVACKRIWSFLTKR